MDIMLLATISLIMSCLAFGAAVAIIAAALSLDRKLW